MGRCQYLWSVVCLSLLAAGPLPDKKVPGEMEIPALEAQAKEIISELNSTDADVSDAACGKFLSARMDCETIIIDKQGTLNESGKAKLEHLINLRKPVDAERRLIWQKSDEVKGSQVKELAKAYESGKYRSDKWDENVRNGIGYFALSLGARESGEKHNDTARASYYFNQAMTAGCNDPAIWVVSVFVDEDLARLAVNESHQRIVHAYEADKNAPTIPYFKALIDGRMVRNSMIDASVSIDSNTALEDMIKQLKLATADKDVNAKLARDMAGNIDLTVLTAKLDRKHYFDLYEGDLESAYPNNADILAHKGGLLVQSAWDARGVRVAGQTTQDQFQAFEDRLKLGKEALTKAWDLDPTIREICESMLRVELGLDGGRDEMDMWFKRGVAIAPTDLTLYRQKLLYLEPKWHGTPEAMLQFGKECADTEYYSAGVPQVISEVYNDIAALAQNPQAFLQQPQVWQDISDVYEKALRWYPDDLNLRVKYIRLADKSAQWTKVVEEVDAIGPRMKNLKPESATEMAYLKRKAQRNLGGQ